MQRAGVVVSVLVVAAATSCKHPASGPPVLELVRAGAPVALDAATSRALLARIEKGLAVCNYSSDSKPDIFGQDLGVLFKQREAASHLRVRYPSPKSLKAVAGELHFEEVLLSVGEPFGPEPALIVHDGRVIGLQMCGYDDRLLGCDPALAGVFPRPAACPPGF